ncbi:MAG: DUF4142 domain-containing protein [Alphaproteobacteria bacterium]|nr:DUF4142 domain-containing protein [Alphaproteobacteria bacterium]
MMKRDYWVGFVAVGMLAVAAFVAHARGVSDTDFIRKATVANRFEIESSQLALDKAKDGKVKDFARQMIDDHTETGQKFRKALAASKADVEQPKELDAKHRQLLDELAALSGDAFDRRYVAIQADAHKEAVKLFRDYSNTGEDETLKRFAGETLPALSEHLEHVQEIKASR